MLVLGGKVGDKFMIGDDVTLIITEVDRGSGQVKLGFDAPRDVSIDREEIRNRKRGGHAHPSKPKSTQKIHGSWPEKEGIGRNRSRDGNR